MKDLKRKVNSLSRGTRQASARGLEGRPRPQSVFLFQMGPRRSNASDFGN